VSTLTLTNQRYVTAIYTTGLDGNAKVSFDGGVTFDECGFSSYTMRWITPSIGLLSSASGGLYRTTDAGRTWTEVLSWTLAILGIAMHDGLRGYAVGANAVLYKTADGGATWTSMGGAGLGIGTTNLNDVACVPGSSSTAYVVGGIYSAKGVILATTNGTSWALQDSGVNQTLTSVAVDPIGTTAITMARYTTNGGATWAAATGMGVTTPAGLCCPKQGVFLAGAGTNNDYMYRSVDGGANWAKPSGVPYMDVRGSFVFAERAYAICSTGLWMSADGGLTWALMRGEHLRNGSAVSGCYQTGPSLDLEVI
jgi:photosystem II stability/assembly factor-like uncharacterized protein